MDAINNPRVFVANFAGHDYTKAEQYGELVFITKGFISFQSLDRVKYQVALSVAESHSDDWLALSGTNIVNVLAAVLWFSMHRTVKILNFDKNTGKYREIILEDAANNKLIELIQHSEEPENG